MQMKTQHIDTTKLKRIVISRPDNIGDVTFTLPMASILKQHFPQCEIIFLARGYVKALIESCKFVDQFLDWEALQQLPDKKIITALKDLNIDLFIHAFPHMKISRLACKAKIKHRISSQSRWYQWLYCNRPVRFSRANSNLHESQLNLKLLLPLGIPTDLSLEELLPHIKLNSLNLAKLSSEIQALIDPQKFNLIIHPGSNGNGREWPTAYFKQLIDELPSEQFKVFITGTKQESALFADTLIKQSPHAINLMGRLTLDQLLVFIQSCDGIIASGTGPLHLGAALGIHALGLFPPKQGMHPQRWQPLGEKSEYLVANHPCAIPKCSNSKCACMQEISVVQVKEVVLGWKKCHQVL